MPYVTSVERQGIKKGQEIGMQQGMQQGMQRGTLLTFREAVMNVLEARFGVVPKSVKNGISRIDEPELLKKLLGEAVAAGTLKDFKGIISGAKLKADA